MRATLVRSVALAVSISFAPLAAFAQASPAPAPSEDPAVTKTATALVAAAQAGKVDRTMFDTQMNASLTDDLLAKSKDQLAPLGTPKSVTFTGQAMSGTVHIYRYRIEFDATSLDELLAYDADGKIGGWRFRPVTPPSTTQDQTVPHSIAQPNRIGVP